MTELLSKRIFIGGLSENVTADEITERFSRFGKVHNVSLKTRNDDDGIAVKSFAHLDFQGDEASIKKCFNTYQNAKWKGSVMKLQYAKESFLEKLQKEREESASEAAAESVSPKVEASPRPAEVVTTAKGVPGTPVPGKKDWVVGKYGRALPVLKLKKSYKVPMVKHDPSKFCHAAREFKEENQKKSSEKPCNRLTWEIDQPDSEITRKRKGEFPQFTPKPKKKPVENDSPSSTLDSNPQNDRRSTLNNGLPKKDKNPSLKTRDPREELEIVKAGAPRRTPKTPVVSNKFDSDLESDSESENYSIPGKLKMNSKQANKSGGLKTPKGPSVAALSNKFDSDLDSDSELPNYSSPSKVKVNSKQANKSGGLKTPKGSNVAALSNKFDSDLDSDSESANYSSPSKVKVNSKHANTPGDLGKSKLVNSLTKTTPALQQQKAVNGFGKAGAVPEFKGLSMLSDLNKESVSSSRSDAKVEEQLTTPSRNTEQRGALSEKKSIKTKKYDVQESDVSVKGDSKNVQEKDASMTSSPALLRKDDNNVNMKSSKTTSKPAIQDLTINREETNQFKRLPEFKGLGMLSDFKIQQGESIPSPRSLKLDSSSNESKQAQKETVSPEPFKQEAMHDSERKEKRSLNKTPVAKSTAGKTNSKVPVEESVTTVSRPEEVNGFASDSSAGTDEIILRHKTKQTGSTPKQMQQSTASQGSTKKLPVVKAKPAAVDLSEFESGVTEASGESPDHKSTSDRGVSDGEDSYDSDLDSNDFALVAKKLRKKQFEEKEKRQKDKQALKIVSKPQRKEEPKPEVSTQGSRREGPESEKVLTGLQSKLLGIAGAEEKKIVPSKPDSTKEVQKYKQLSEKEKRQIANEKRLEAMREQAKLRDHQLQVMKDALKNVDSSASNTKRIVFESSSEDDEPEDKSTAKVTEKSGQDKKAEKSAQDKKAEKSVQDKKAEKSVQDKKAEKSAQDKKAEKSVSISPVQESKGRDNSQAKPGPSLFDASSDEEESEAEDYDEMFKSKPQFEGRKGEQLLKLEKSFGDKRFKLDAKFADTDSEGEAEKEEEGPAEGNTGDVDLTTSLKEEKSASLKVLEGIVGKTTLDRFTQKISRNTKTIIDMNTVRFDPTKMRLQAPAVPVSPAEVKKKENRPTVTTAQPEKKKQTEGDSPATPSQEGALAKGEKRQAEEKESQPAQKRVKFDSESDEDDGGESEQEEKDEKEKKSVAEKSGDKAKKKDPKLANSQAKQSRAEVSHTLVDLFKTKEQLEAKGGGDTEEGSFSLLQQFGEVDSDDEEEEEEEKTSGKLFNFEKNTPKEDAPTKSKIADTSTDMKAVGKSKKQEEASGLETESVREEKKVRQTPGPESDDSADESGEEVEMDTQEISAPSTDVKNEDGINTEMINAGKMDVRFTKEAWLDQWDTLRLSIIKIYKKKHKDALKKKRIHGETKRKRDFLKNSKKAGKKHWGSLKKR